VIAMSDRYHSLTVVFEGELLGEDAEKLMSAILMLKNVIKVTPNVVTSDHYEAKVIAKNELYQKIAEVFYPEFYSNHE